jgi:hypothetical protein
MPQAYENLDVKEVPGLKFNVFRHGTVTRAELQALAQL